MAQPPFQESRIGPNPLHRIGRRGFRIVVFAWGIILALAFVALWVPSRQGSRWPDAALLIVTCFAALANAMRSLPAQNVLAAACVLGGVGGTVHAISAATGIPFGSCVYTLDIGRLVFDFFPWPVAFLWIVLVITSRGTARLILAPVRGHYYYGYYVLALSTALVVLLDVALEVFCSRVRTYWEWPPTTLAVDWYGVPLGNFVGWAFVSFFTLAFITPFLITKSPRPEPGPDFMPLLFWAGISAFLTVSIFQAGFLPPAVLQFALTLFLGVLAALGGFRQKRRAGL